MAKQIFVCKDIERNCDSKLYLERDRSTCYYCGFKEAFDNCSKKKDTAPEDSNWYPGSLEEAADKARDRSLRPVSRGTRFG